MMVVNIMDNNVILIIIVGVFTFFGVNAFLGGVESYSKFEVEIKNYCDRTCLMDKKIDYLSSKIDRLSSNKKGV